MKSKIVDRETIISLFKDGQTIAIGGQANHGSPNRLIQCLIDSGVKHLTTISLDTGAENVSIGRLIHHGMVDKVITAYAGRNKEGIALYNAGKMKIELVPMGSLIEKIRCGGTGLGGVLTKTGLGTIVEEGHELIHINGEDYLVEPAIRADIAISRARKADPIGNLTYYGTGYSSNPIVAMDGDISIVEADFLVDINELNMDEVKVPSAFIDMILG